MQEPLLGNGSFDFLDAGYFLIDFLKLEIKLLQEFWNRISGYGTLSRGLIRLACSRTLSE